MANRSYLFASDEHAAVPKDLEILANGAWCVPLLWLPMFVPEDLVRAKEPTADGGFIEMLTPIATVAKAIEQIHDAVPYLNALFRPEGALDKHVALIEDLLDGVGHEYVGIELSEIAGTIDVKSFNAKLVEVLTHLASGEPRPEARALLAELSGVRLERRFLDPAVFKTPKNKATDDEAWNHGMLLGGSYARAVPWEP